MKFKAAQLDQMRKSLTPLLGCGGMFGVKVARNLARLDAALAGFDERSLAILKEHGEEVTDDTGRLRYGLSPDSPEYERVIRDINELATTTECEFAPDVATDADAAESGATAAELVAVFWMLEN